MKRLISLLALAALAGCSTTSNDITQNLESLPAKATSWQCDSGNRIIAQPSRNDGTELRYRGDVIKVAERANEASSALEGAGLTWQTKGLYAELSGTYSEDGVAYTERCTQVLTPEVND